MIKFKLYNKGVHVGFEEVERLNDGNLQLVHRMKCDLYGTNIGLLYIQHDERRQFTGLCDKKGEEVYQKDTLADYHKNIYIVEWHKNDARWALFTESGEWYLTSFYMKDLLSQMELIKEPTNER